MGISNIRCVSQPPPPNGKIVPCGTGDELPQSKPDGFSSSLGEGCRSFRYGWLCDLPANFPAMPRAPSPRTTSPAPGEDVGGRRGKSRETERLPPLRGKMSPKVTKGGVWHRAKRDDWGSFSRSEPSPSSLRAAGEGCRSFRYGWLCDLPANFPAMPRAPSQRGLSAQQTGGVFSPKCLYFRFSAPES